jgi:two-component system, OmpR family, sensor kinase
VSLRTKVTCAFTAMLAFVLAAAGAFLYVRFEDDLHENQDRGLRSRAAQLAVAVERGGVTGRLPDAPGIEADEDVAQVLSADGAVVAGNAAASAPLLTPAQLDEAERGELFVDRPEDERLDEALRVLARPVSGGAVVVVGESADEVNEAASTLLLLEALGLGAALLAGAIGAWLVAGAVVRPVNAALKRERRFVADASHELRTPLAVLKSELEVARMEDGDPGAAVASAEEEVDRLRRLADDLLVLARADADGIALRESKFDLDEVFERATRGAPSVEVERSGLRVHGDVLRLEQAVRNLVDNAARHGEPPVRVGAAAHDGGVVISVRDHGAGLPEGFAERAFDRFARGDAGRGRGGAGLGLSIVAAIAAAHGGHVRLVNAEPGTLAELTLPNRSLTHAVGE